MKTQQSCNFTALSKYIGSIMLKLILTDSSTRQTWVLTQNHDPTFTDSQNIGFNRFIWQPCWKMAETSIFFKLNYFSIFTEDIETYYMYKQLFCEQWWVRQKF